MARRRVQQIFGKGSNVQRNRYDFEIESLGPRPDEPLGDDREQVRLRDDMQSLQILGNAQYHVSLATIPAQPGVQRIFGEFRTHHRDMCGSQKSLSVETEIKQRMTAPDRDGVPIDKEALLVEALEAIGNARDRKVNGTCQLDWLERTETAGLGSNGYARSLRLQMPQQRRQQ